MMKGRHSSEMPVIIYQVTWCNIKEGLNPKMPSLGRIRMKLEGWNPDESDWLKLLTGSDVCVQ
jgi:hypothetical protein